MSKMESYTGPTDLVYGIGPSGEDVIYADRETALYVAELYEALMSRTWGDFRDAAPPGAWEEFMEKRGCDYDNDGNPIDDFPTGAEPFGAYIETGYPEWLAASMLSWFPQDLIDKYGGSVASPSFDGAFSLVLPSEVAEDIAVDLRTRGCTVEPSPVVLI